MTNADLRAPLRVLHLLPMLRVGGMEQGVVTLCNHHDPAVVRAAVCSFHESDAVMRQRLAPSVALFEMNKRHGNDPYLIWRLARLFRRERISIVHTHSWGTLLEGYLAARIAGVRWIVHGEHGTMETRQRNLAVQKWLWNRVDRVFSVSSRLAERMATTVGFPREAIAVVRNGTDLGRFDGHDRVAQRRALGIDDDTLLVVAVGRLVPVKDQATLLRAMAVVRDAGVDAQLVLVGDGPLRDELLALVTQLGIAELVTLTGARSDVAPILAAGDVFVLSSLSEGLSNTLIEAMASGLPSVATQVGGADEIVIDGQTGLLTPPARPDLMGAALVRLARDPARRIEMSRLARTRAKESFSLPGMVAAYEAAYLALARGR